MSESLLRGKPIPKLPIGAWMLLDKVIPATREGELPVQCCICGVGGAGKRGWYKRPYPSLIYACPPCYRRGKKKRDEPGT